MTINPNSKIPAIVDPDGPNEQPISLFESGAILFYLTSKTGKFLPTGERGKYEAMQWLMFKMGVVEPIFGQTHHFLRFTPEKISYAIKRYSTKTARLYTVLDKPLAEVEHLAGDYSIAKMATFPWVGRHEWQAIDLADFSAVRRW